MDRSSKTPPPSTPIRPVGTPKPEESVHQATKLVAGRKMTWTPYGNTFREQIVNWFYSLFDSKYANEARSRFYEEVKSEITGDAQKALNDFKSVRQEKQKMWRKLSADDILEIDISKEKQALKTMNQIIENILSIPADEMSEENKKELIREVVDNDFDILKSIYSNAATSHIVKTAIENFQNFEEMKSIVAENVQEALSDFKSVREAKAKIKAGEATTSIKEIDIQKEEQALKTLNQIIESILSMPEVEMTHENKTKLILIAVNNDFDILEKIYYNATSLAVRTALKKLIHPQ